MKQKQKYFDFVMEFSPYIFLIFILNASITLWWGYLTFYHGLFEWIITKAIKNIFIVLVLNLFIIHMFFIFLNYKARFVVYFFVIFSIISFILQSYLLINYSAKFNPLFLEVLLQTSLVEILEFTQTYIDKKTIIYICIFLICVPFYLYICKKYNIKFFVKNLTAIKLFNAIYFLIVFGLLIDCANRYFIKKQGINSIDKINFAFFVDIPEQFLKYYFKNGIWGDYNFYLKNYEKIASSYAYGGGYTDKK